VFKTICSSPLKAIVLAATLAAGAASAAPSTQFTVTGAVSTPAAYDLAGLQTLPSVTQTVTFASGTTPQTHTYTGASLWGVLDGAGIVTTPSKNDVLNRYVLATGSDGYQTVFSLGELNPGFGNRPDLLAYAETVNGVSSPLTSEGFARVTAPGDVKGGRYVSNLVNLDVRSSGSTQAGTGGGVSSQFSVSGAVGNAMSFDLGALEGLTQITQTVNGHLYTGVSFWDLLNKTVGIDLNPGVKNDVLGKYVVATGSDGYKSLFSLGELSDAFGNQPDMIAYEVDGEMLTDTGFARLVVPNDVKAGRWVSNLVSLEVFSATPVPEPQTYALMLTGLMAVAAIARPKKQRQNV
jgi:DMSO/TMAO reductase YedYZ molybdopterin-dependent catalytic subunit